MIDPHTSPDASGFAPPGPEESSDPRLPTVDSQDEVVDRDQCLDPLRTELEQRLGDEARRRLRREKNLVARRRSRTARPTPPRVPTQTLTYLGDRLSGGLQDRRSRLDRLADHPQLPVLHDADDLAAAMGIETSELRFLAFAPSHSKVNHYQRFLLPKKTGGHRQISAPMPRLKAAQHWIYQRVLAQVPVHRAAKGFLPGHSIVDNARPHVGADVVINMDLENFFPTITFARVKGLFRTLGYSEQVATILGLLCTEPEVETYEWLGERYHVARGPRFLPQGAPSSPPVTNLLCRRLDRRLDGLARSLGFHYTRYADDLTFSGSGEATDRVGKLLGKARDIIEHEGFRPHPKKTRVLRAGRQQEVTGIVVNRKLSLDRKTLRRFRAVLFQVEHDGPAGKRWGSGGDLLASLEGYAHFVHMVDAEKGRAFLDRVEAIKARYGSDSIEL